MRRQLGATKREPSIQQPATNSLGEAELESLAFAEKQSRYSTMMAESALRFAETVKALSPQGLVASADKIAKLDQVARKAVKLESDKPRSAINIRLLAGGGVSRLQIDSAEPAQEPLHLVEETGSCPALVESDASQAS